MPETVGLLASQLFGPNTRRRPTRHRHLHQQRRRRLYSVQGEDKVKCTLNSGARDEALCRLREYGAVVLRDVVPPEQCRAMRRDMWRHVETVAPGLRNDDPSTWELWTQRGNYGMPGKKTIFTPPFLALRQSERVAACFAALMEEHPEDLIASHDRWLLCVECSYRVLVLVLVLGLAVVVVLVGRGGGSGCCSCR